MARYVVTGAAVVLATVDGTERYLYEGAPFNGEAFIEERVRRAVELGLIAEVDEPAAAEEEDEPYKGVTVPDLKAEIDKRNEGRADGEKIAPAEPGKRAELVAALVADDNRQ